MKSVGERLSRPIAGGLFGILLAMTSGCVDIGVGGETAPSRFYVLSATDSGVTPSANGPSLLVGPVTLPRYLDRPQIVTRPTPNQLSLAEYDRWGGRLDDNVTRVLTQDLSVHMNTSRVAVFPREQRVPNATQISLDVARFEQVGGGEVDLEAQWAIYPPEQRRGPMIGTSRIKVQPKGDDFAAIVAAMSEAIDRLAQEIAAELRKLPKASAAGGN